MRGHLKCLLVVLIVATFPSACGKKKSKRGPHSEDVATQTQNAGSSDSSVAGGTVITKEIDGKVVVLPGILSGDKDILDSIDKISAQPGDGSDFLVACQATGETAAIVDALKKMVKETDCLRAHDKLIYMKEFWVTQNIGIDDVALLAKLSNISLLHLSDNNLVDIGPLAKLENLEVLHLDNNRISDLTPLANLKKIRALNLKGNELVDLTVLSKLENLSYLDLDLNRISDLRPLSSLTKLTGLLLSGNKIDDISVLTTLSQLRELHLSSNPLQSLLPLSNLTALKRLHITSTQVQTLRDIAGLAGLEILAAAMTPVAASRTAENCPVTAQSPAVQAFCVTP